MSVPQTMVDVHTHVRTWWDLLHAAVEVGFCLPAMDWAVMVRKGGREGGREREREEGRMASEMGERKDRVFTNFSSPLPQVQTSMSVALMVDVLTTAPTARALSHAAAEMDSS